MTAAAAAGEAGPAEAAPTEAAHAADAAPPARLYGEPLLELPADLYIPPQALAVVLEAFEGPLDLLLWLIRRHNLDILDIPMAELTRQYLAYVDEARGRSLELAADYLLMAATLIEIKSRMLLPVRREPGQAEPEDPRAELVRRLIEYERFREAAARLDALPQAGRDFHVAHAATAEAAPDAAARWPRVLPGELADAWRAVLARAALVAHHTVGREALSVREQMGVVLRRLRGRRFAEFHELFDPARGAAVAIVTFIAVLELARERLLDVTQAEAYAPIYLRLASDAAAPGASAAAEAAAA